MYEACHVTDHETHQNHTHRSLELKAVHILLLKPADNSTHITAHAIISSVCSLLVLSLAASHWIDRGRLI